jgi:peptidoglycan/LPS O-acetylase OafA/YrhL
MDASTDARQSEMTGSARYQATVDSLTGLRFIAALSVLVAHATNGVMTFEPKPALVNYFSQGPGIGMPLFFVLSGFVIHYNYGHSFRAACVAPLIDFFIARFARLYPLYLLLLAVFILNERLLPGILSGNYDLWVFPRYFMLWQAWLIEYQGTTWFGHLLLPPAWSISVEVFFYMLYPLLAVYLLRIRAPSHAGLIFAALVIAYYIMIIFCYHKFDALRLWGNDTFQINSDPQNALLGWLLNTGPIGRLFELLMGALAAQTYLLLRDRPPSKRENIVGSVGLLVTVCLASVFYLGIQNNPFLAFAGSYPGGLSPLLSVIIFCCARYRNPLSHALESRSMVRMGEASYSIYLIHLFTLQLFNQQLTFSYNAQNVVIWALVILGAISFTIVVSLGTYQVVEAPSRAYLRRTYGQSCSAFVPPLPAVNLFKNGNATAAIRQGCAGLSKCSYLIDVNRIGDPAQGCAKSFSVAYRCPFDAQTRTGYSPPEANGRRIVLDCTKDSSQLPPIKDIQ